MPPATDPGPVTVRAATPDDALFLAELGARTFEDGYRDLMDPAPLAAFAAEAFGPEQQAAELADPTVHVAIAEVDGVGVGYVHVVETAPDIPIVSSRPVAMERLYVDRAAQGSGVGRALFAWAIDAARRLGADVLWLGVWERNERAIAIYERWGFVTVGEVPFPIGAEIHRDLLMARPLADREL